MYARRAHETHVHILWWHTERPPKTVERDAVDAEAAASNPSPTPLLRLIQITTKAITEIKGRGGRREAAGTTNASLFFFADLPQEQRPWRTPHCRVLQKHRGVARVCSGASAIAFRKRERQPSPPTLTPATTSTTATTPPPSSLVQPPVLASFLLLYLP